MGWRVVVKLSDPKRKTLGEKGIDCIFVGYAEHSKAYRFYVIEPNDYVSINSIIESRDAIFNENRFSSIPRPKDIIPHSVESQRDDHFDDIPSNKHKVCKLVKSLYGLKQAPKQWHQKFDEVVLSSGFLLNQSDKCVYSKFNDSGKGVIICLYVDDMLIFGTDQNKVDKTKKFLSSRFSMKDMGEANVILGIKIKRKNKGIVITQSHYIEKILKKFNREDCSLVSTLMDPVEKLRPNTGKPVDQLEYSRAIGCLMYAMTSTRPDIAYAFGRLSRFTSNPSRQHCAATLDKAYSQMYNGKSRQLGVKHNMISQYKDAKTLFEAIQARFSDNDATKKTQRTLLKQMYENFNAPSTESIDSIFNMLQKIVSQLAILGENISQEDLNMKFLRSLPFEWNTHVVWRNKADLDTMSIDDLYKNFKIVEQEVKRTVASSSNSRSPNMAFLSSHSSTNEVDANSIQFSDVSTPVSTVSSYDNTANLSDANVYAFLANQPNGSQLMHEDLEQIHEDDLEEIDLKWQLALLSIRARRSPRNQESRTRNQDNSRKTVNVEDTSSKAMVVIDGAGFDWSYMANDEVSTNMALSAFSDLERSSFCRRTTCLLQEERGYGPKDSKSVCVDTSNEIKKVPDALIIEDWVSDSDEDESEEIVLISDNVQHKPEQANQHRKVAFGGGANSGKITSKGTIKTGKLDFKDVYFVKELQFNLFSVSQMCDKKNNVLFTDTECFVLSPNFKLADESQVLLKVPRKNNMYNFDIKNIVPQKDLTCLFAKATNDESMLWHMRLGHINFKNINKLVKDNLVRGLPSKRFKNDQTCVACLKGKQHKVSDQLGKFDGKLDEGIFVGYSTTSKAFRVYNIRTRKVEENMHITFLKNKHMIVGGGPEWLFDIDALSKSINYAPIFAGTNSNDFAGKGACFDAGQSRMETGSIQDYILMPLWKDNSLYDSPSQALDGHNQDKHVNTATPTYVDYPNDPLMSDLEDAGIFDDAYDDRDEGA
nr:zinc finger, CCHC-type [Tanacetum cinerariifolium]